MTTTTNVTKPTTDTLATLRSLAARGASKAEARTATERQAAYLEKLLAESVKSIPDRLIELIPNLDITYSNDFSGHGFSFWDDDTRQWCIYLCSRDSGYDQVFTTLREIKCIVDEPLQKEPDDPGKSIRMTLANYFAYQVIERLSQISE